MSQGTKLTLFLGADHAGLPLKNHLKEKLQSLSQYAVEDLGTNSTDSTDYPDRAADVARRVGKGEGLGILVCGSGIGVAIAANKVAGVRASVVWDATSARLSKEHNNVNILCVGARLLGTEVAWDAVRAWLDAVFQEGRHADRVKKISALEGKS